MLKDRVGLKMKYHFQELYSLVSLLIECFINVRFELKCRLISDRQLFQQFHDRMGNTMRLRLKPVTLTIGVVLGPVWQLLQ